MTKYAHGTPFTYVYDKFVYYEEDFDCTVCANYKGRGGHGCGCSVCEFQELKDDATRHNRIKRPRGWQKSCIVE